MQKVMNYILELKGLIEINIYLSIISGLLKDWGHPQPEDKLYSAYCAEVKMASSMLSDVTDDLQDRLRVVFESRLWKGCLYLMRHIMVIDFGL